MFEIQIQYDTSAPSRRIDAYRLNAGELDTGENPHPLRQIGETFNGVVSYRGLFQTRAEALTAALDYLPNCAIVEVVNGGGEAQIALRPRADQGRTLGRKTNAGVFVAP